MLANACFFLWFILSQSRGFLNRPCHGVLIGMPCDDITSSLERYKILSIISTAVYIREWCLRLMIYFIYFSVLDSVNTCWFLKIRFFFWNCVFWYRIFALKLYSHYCMSIFWLFVLLIFTIYSNEMNCEEVFEYAGPLTMNEASKYL